MTVVLIVLFFCYYDVYWSCDVIFCSSLVMFYWSLSVERSIAFFFFKQKTAYEMRISDWSSDVCSSDLPLVVPTLVDHETGRILADSKAICLYLCDALSGGTDLLPADIREAVLKQVQLADTTPHVALLYGADPDGDRRPESMQAVMPGIHAHKIDAVQIGRAHV